MAARKQPTLNDAYDVLARIALSLEKLASANTFSTIEAEAEPEQPAKAQDKPLLPVSSPTTAPDPEAPAAPTQPAVPVDAPSLALLQESARSYMRGVEDKEEQNKRMNQVQGLLLKLGAQSLKDLDAAGLAAFGDGLAELAGGQ